MNNTYLKKIHLFKAKYINVKTLLSVLFKIGRFIIVFGLCFIILYPFFLKTLSSIMSPEDLLDPTIKYVAKHPSVYFFQKAFESLDFWNSFKNTLFLSLITATIQIFISAFVGYGFSRFKYKGKEIVFSLIIFTLLVPPQLILTPLFFQFRFFSLFGLNFNLIDTFYPFAILALTGLGIKNGLYIYMMRQFFNGIPIELEEAAYVDGIGVFKTFWHIILPNAIPMMVTIFLFSFAWQWTDTIYSNILFSDLMTLPKVIFKNIVSINNDPIIVTTTRNTASLLVIIPLIVIYLFAQKKFVEGVERSGMVG